MKNKIGKIFKEISIMSLLALLMAFLPSVNVPNASAAVGDGLCNGGDATISAPPSGSFVKGTIAVNWSYNGDDCTNIAKDPSVFNVEVNHGAGWTWVVTSTAVGDVSASFNSVGNPSSPDDFDYQFRLIKGGSIVDSTSYSDVTIDNTSPAPTAARISTSGATGTGGAFKIGDTVKAVWDASATGDNDANMSGTNGTVTMNLSEFGGGASVSAVDNGSACGDTAGDKKWTACYTIAAGSIDSTTADAIIASVTDAAGNVATVTPVTGTENRTVDNRAPVITAGKISLTGANGNGGEYIIGDTVTVTWDASTEATPDTIASVSVDFSQFDGLASSPAFDDGSSCSDAVGGDNIWRACHVITAGSINNVGSKNVSVLATDNAGNIAGPVSDDTNATVDDVKPTGTVTLSVPTLNDTNLVQLVTVTFDEPMDGTSITGISFTGNTGAMTSSADGAWNVGSPKTVWTEHFTLTDANEQTTGVTVHGATGAQDAAGNNEGPDVPDTFDIDTASPVITVAGTVTLTTDVNGDGFASIGDTITYAAGTVSSADGDSWTVDLSSYGLSATAAPGAYVVPADNDDGAFSATESVTDNDSNTTTGAVTAVSFTNIDNIVPTVSNGAISITSSGSGTGGAYVTGDTVTVQWDDTIDGNAPGETLFSVKVDFSQFGGGSAVTAADDGSTCGDAGVDNKWTSCYTIVSGSIDATNLNVSVTVRDNARNSTTAADTSNLTLDNKSPVITAANIGLSGGTGTGGAYKIGDVVKATWDATADGNSDIASLAVSFTGFGGGSVAAGDAGGACDSTASDGIWSACYTNIAGVIDTTNVNVALTATDNASNVTGPVSGTNNATVDNEAPNITANGTLSISTDNGVVGVAALNNGTSTQDKVTQSAVTMTDADALTNVTTIDLTGLTGEPALAAATASGVVIPGALDNAAQTFTITVSDNAGNTSTTASDAISVDNIAPIITVSGTVTVTTNNVGGANAAIGDGVTFNAGTVSVADTDTWIANMSAITGVNPRTSGVEDLVIAGAIDSATYAVTEIVTDNAGNIATDSTSTFDVDNIAPIITAANIGLSGATGTGGAYKIGDIVKATWNASADGNGDITAPVTVDFTVFGGGAAVAANDSGTGCDTSSADGIWSACYTNIAGTNDATNVNVTFSATDNAGNATGPVTDDTNATVDNQAPNITAPGTLTITTDKGVGGVAALNDGSTNQDKVTQSAVTLSVSDTDVTTIDLTALTGQAAVSATVESGVVIPGALDNATQTFTITVTDNAGNASTTTSASISVDNVAPVVSFASITVAGATGTGGAFKNADTPTLTWNATTSGESDTISAVSFDGSKFKAGDTALVGAGGPIWTASLSGAMDAQDDTGNDITATVTDDAGNISGPVTSSTSYTVDTNLPTVTGANVYVTGATGTAGAVKFGDTPVLTWSQTGDSESDTIASATFDGSSFKSGDTARSGSFAGGLWTAGLSGSTDLQDTTGNTITVTVVDDVGNSTGPITSTPTYIIDTIVPVVTGGNITVTGATGAAGVFIIGDTPSLRWNQTANGETDTIASATFDGSSFKAVDTALSGVYGAPSWTTGLSGAMDAQETTGNSINATVVDDAGNSTGPISSTATYTIDTVAPTLTSVSIASSNANPSLASIGNTVTLSFTGSENLQTSPAVTFSSGGNAVTGAVTVLGGPTAWTASYMVNAADSRGNVTFTIDFDDTPGNAGTQVTSTTDASSIIVVNSSVVFTDPAAGATVSSPFTVSVDTTQTTASCRQGTTPFSIPYVTYGTLMTSSGGTGYTIDVTAVDGPITIHVVCLDENSNLSTDQSRSFTVSTDVTAPAVPVITTGTATVNADFYTIFGTAGADTPNDTVRTIQVYNGATLAGTVEVPVGQAGWSVVVPLTQSAANSFTAKSTDTYGNTSLSSVAVVITEDPGLDVTAPAIPVITTGTATVNADFYTIVGTAGADTPVDTVRTIQVYNGATLAGTADVPVGQTDWSVVVELSQSSANSFTATSTDIYGNTSAASGAVVITEDPTAGADVTAPAVPVITTGTATVNSDFYTIVGTAGVDMPGDTVRSIQVYNGATLAGTVNVPIGQTDWSVVVPLIQSSANSFTATSTDAFGNTSAASVAVVITEDPGLDVTAPAVPVIANGTATVNADVYLIFGTAGADTPSDTVRTIQVYESASLVGTVDVPVGQTDWSVVVPLIQGSANTFTATSTDFYGNTSAASVAVVITEDPGLDVTAPAVPVITTGTATVNSDFYTIVGTSGADTPVDTVRTVQVYESATLVGTVDVPVGQTDWSVVVPLTQSSANTISATSTDVYGNTSAASVAVVITEDPTAGTDVTAPAVPVITTGTATVNADFYTIVGTAGADTPNDTVRSIQVYNGATLAGTVNVSIGQTDWSVVVELGQSSANSFTAISTDAFGNVSAASVAVVITEDPTTGADVTAPAVPVIANGATTVDADFYTIFGTAGADTPNDTVRTIQVYEGASLVGTVEVPIGQTDWSVVVPLSQSSANSFSATSTDAYGNVSVASGSVVITEATPADTTAPVTTIVTPVASTNIGTSTTLQVTTDEDSSCEYNIGGAFLYGAGTTFTTTGNTTHSEALSALAGGSNTVYVNCQDSSINNLDFVNASVTFTVDNQVPDITYAPIANQHNQSAVPANIVFTLSDDTGVTTLTLATDGASPADVYGASSGGTTYTLPLSSVLGQHEYVLIAGDVLGQTKTTTVSYLVVADSVTNINITDFTVSGLTDTSITLNWTTDATASSSVVDFFTSGSSALNQAAVIALTDNSITYGGLTANKQYTVVMKSKVTGQTNYTTLTTMFTTAGANTGLSVDSIQMTKTYATADNTYANGWAWKFNVTVNDMTETLVAMKFAQWASGANLLSAGGNMQYSVDNGVTWTPIVTNATYGANIDVSAIDLDALSGGRQIEFLVQMKIPALTPGGSYSTSYGIQSL